MFKYVNRDRAEVSIVQAEGPKRNIEGSDSYFSSMIAEPPAGDDRSIELSSDLVGKWAKYIEELAAMDDRRRYSRKRDRYGVNDLFNGRKRRVGFL